LHAGHVRRARESRKHEGMYPAAMRAGLTVAIIATAQTLMPSGRQLAELSRRLQAAEIAVLLEGVRGAMADKTFTLSLAGREDGPEVLMRGEGRRARVRTAYGMSGGWVSADGSQAEWHDDFIDVVDHTGVPAKRCDGTAAIGELVITYQYRASTNAWTATAATTGLDFRGIRNGVGGPICNILSGSIPIASDIARRSGDGRVLRALTAPFHVPPHSARNGYGLGDPPRQATQSLWIDTNSLL